MEDLEIIYFGKWTAKWSFIIGTLLMLLCLLPALNLIFVIVGACFFVLAFSVNVAAFIGLAYVAITSKINRTAAIEAMLIMAINLPVIGIYCLVLSYLGEPFNPSAIN
jgi:ABC-type transport system involved in cytochrome c biogenesis permease component